MPDRTGFSFGVVFMPRDLAMMIHNHCGIRLGDFGGAWTLRCFDMLAVDNLLFDLLLITSFGVEIFERAT